MKQHKSFWFILFIVALVLAACAGQQQATGIQVQGAWVRAMGMGETQNNNMGQATPMSGMQASPMGGTNSAGYMVIVNNTGQADRLLRVESDIAGAVELHESKMVNDVMTMTPVDGIDLPAGGQAELKPGGLHIMFIGLKRDLKPGDKVTLTLVFEKAPSMTIDVEVKQQ